MGTTNDEFNRKYHKISMNEKKEEEMTHGVEIVQWRDEKDGKVKIKIEIKITLIFYTFKKKLFSLWDFAGHEGNYFFLF